MAADLVRVRLGNIMGYCHQGGEVSLEYISGETRSYHGRTAGKGAGDLAALRLVWGCLLTWAIRHGVKTLWCEPTASDGRGQTRTRVYRRAGFVETKPGWMELGLTK